MLENKLAGELRLAILTNQLQMAIQPKVSLKTLNTIGGEVLLRWDHPKLGFIPADKWVKIAESHGLMPQLNCWVVTQVITFIKNSNLLMPLAINISPTSMTISFVTFMIEELKKHNIPYSLLEVEITESTPVDNMSLLSHCIRLLRKKGIQVSLDDFGSGYCSMRYLVELDVDKIKIDKSFIQKAADHYNARLILKKMIDLGKEIHLKILCEGIETLDHLNLIQSLGADEGQGYYFGNPQLVKTCNQAKKALNLPSSFLKAS